MAIAFADDVCLVAKSPEEAQTLLHHAQYYYVAASATLCAPKSVWTGTRPPGAWEIELFFPWSEYQVTEEEVSLLATECRAWHKDRSSTAGTRAPAHPADVREVRGKGVILSRDQLYLEGLGDSVSAGNTVSAAFPPLHPGRPALPRPEGPRQSLRSGSRSDSFRGSVHGGCTEMHYSPGVSQRRGPELPLLIPLPILPSPSSSLLPLFSPGPTGKGAPRGPSLRHHGPQSATSLLCF